MKITKRQLRRIIKEEKARLVSEGRYDQRRKYRDAMVAQMTFKKLRNKAWDLAGSLQGRLSTGQYESDDYWDREHGQIPMLADIVDAAKIKAAEEGITFDDPPEIRVNGGIFDYSGDYSLGLPAGVMESKSMKITKRQLRRIIQEAVINEALPPHLKKHFNKDGSAKVHNPMGYEIKDVTPAGYGPDEADSYEGFAIQQEPDGTWVGVRYDFGRQHRYPNHPTKESLFKIIDRHQKRNFGYQGDDA